VIEKGQKTSIEEAFVMNNLAIVEVEEKSVPESCKLVLAYSRDENSAKGNAKIVESIVDRQLANGSMPA
jgi:hypothetical protein